MGLTSTRACTQPASRRVEPEHGDACVRAGPVATDIPKSQQGVLSSRTVSRPSAGHQIIVLDEGRIVDTGSHDALMERGGLYAKLFSMQQAAYAANREE